MCATMRSTDASSSRPRGTILPATALILFCTALLGLWVAHSQLAALRSADQELRMRELFAVAGTGLEAAFAEAALLLETEPAFDAGGRFRIAGPAGIHDGWSYETFIHNEMLLPFNLRIIEIESLARDDSGGVRRQRQQARLRPWLATIPSAPVIVHGAAVLPGDVILRNMHGDVLAWSGGVFTAPYATLDAAESARCPPAGICELHAVLAAREGSAAFEYWLGREHGALRSASAQHDAIGWMDGAIVIEGIADYGSAAAPQLLIIAGDLEVRGTLKVHGVLYVDGSLEGTGDISVHGALIVAGDAMHQGRMAIAYEPGALQVLAQRGTYARIPGSWNDF